MWSANHDWMRHKPQHNDTSWGLRSMNKVDCTSGHENFTTQTRIPDYENDTGGGIVTL